MVFATNKTNRDDITEIFFESGVKHNPTNTQENKYIIMYGYIMDFIWTLWIRWGTIIPRCYVWIKQRLKSDTVEYEKLHLLVDFF